MEDALLGEKTIAFSIAQEILNTNINIPTLPANGKKILSVVRKPQEKIDIPEFVKLVESDPGLFVRILKLANSPFYSEVEKIVSLRAAITRIGLEEVVNTVCLYFFQKLLPKFPDIPGLTYNDFWAHSWACAVANRRLGHPNLEMGVLPGELYMAGMLQGMGKLLLAIHYPKKFAQTVQKARQDGLPLAAVEKEVFGTTGNLIGSKVMISWELPPNICHAIAFCQCPELAPPEHIIIAGLTQFACSIVAESRVGSSGDGFTPRVTETFFGKNPNLKISQPLIQKKLLKEIYLTINERAHEVTTMGVEDTSKTKSAQPGRYQKIDNAESSREKKGLLGWMKSLLR